MVYETYLSASINVFDNCLNRGLVAVGQVDDSLVLDNVCFSDQPLEDGRGKADHGGVRKIDAIFRSNDEVAIFLLAEALSVHQLSEVFRNESVHLSSVFFFLKNGLNDLNVKFPTSQGNF